jgi:hypothetical protein
MKGAADPGAVELQISFFFEKKYAKTAIKILSRGPFFKDAKR